MEQYIAPERVANAIMMDKSFKGYHLIVEGEKDDKLFDKFINRSLVSIKIGFGFEKVKTIIRLLSERGFSNKIGIIDSDFSAILNDHAHIDGLFLTDEHDIEVMLVNSNALESVLKVFASTAKINDFQNATKKTIRDILLEIGSEIGLLKLANRIHKLGLLFKPEKPEGNQIKYREFIDDKKMILINRNQLIDTIINYSRQRSNSIKTKQEISNKLEEISSVQYDTCHLVNGHDLSNLLYIFLKKTMSSRNKMLQDFNSVEDSLILAYEFEEFKTTGIYKMIAQYEIDNSVSIWRN